MGPVKVVALGITNQRETTVVWNKTTGLPLYNAVVWLDTRTAELCERMEQELGSKVSRRRVGGALRRALLRHQAPGSGRS